MSEDRRPALLLAIGGLLALLLAWQHVTLRDAWRVHDLALSSWHATQEVP